MSSLSPAAATALSLAAAIVAVDALPALLAPYLSPAALAVLDTLVGHGALAGAQCFAAHALHALPHAPERAALCALLSVGMDADHFIQARALSLRAALSLPSRPFAHSLPFLACAVAAAAAAAAARATVLGVTAPPWLPHIVAAALGGHQLRDSLKRGLWAGGALGSTPPTPYFVYLAVMAAVLPVALGRALAALHAQPLLPL